MIITGWQGRENVLSRGAFHCPRCQAMRAYKHSEVFKDFTLYWIPLFEMSRVGEFAQCETCELAMSPELAHRLSQLPQAPGLIAELHRQIEAGRPIHELLRLAMSASLAEEQAVELLQLLTQEEDAEAAA